MVSSTSRLAGARARYAGHSQTQPSARATATARGTAEAQAAASARLDAQSLVSERHLARLARVPADVPGADERLGEDAPQTLLASVRDRLRRRPESFTPPRASPTPARPTRPGTL